MNKTYHATQAAWCDYMYRGAQQRGDKVGAARYKAQREYHLTEFEALRS